MAALGVAAIIALAGPASANMPGLPSGLPELPSLGEAMQRDVHSGLALSGYDPVAYRLGKQAVAGLPDYELVHEGAVWRFVSAANREAFRDAPDIYAPAFAGFDAAAVAQGRAVETDPRHFAIVGSRLFLFRTPESRRSFIADAQLRKTAETRWQELSESFGR
ncbi:hypothetical protein ASE63_07785 [Bosea sp. Root381]|uniref:YHS domain-containing (seleno)protein n=1 Tax=Bosea sp. Root381 TaxID=1736524 RepID=UPI0006FF4839|nr:YHS domain-containing (seleno)protein [Bosea sp. Root381]KRE02253.1 hypothetical protein ASE63_07785 [Bosea sp. Root381]